MGGCSAETHLTFLDPQGPIAAAQRRHFYWVLTVMAVLVAAPIFILLPFWAWRYRDGNKSSVYNPNWEFSKGPGTHGLERIFVKAKPKPGLTRCWNEGGPQNLG